MQTTAQSGSDRCNWIDAGSSFSVSGPSSTETDPTARHTINIGRASGIVVRPAIYRVIPKMAGDTINSVLCADDVAGNPRSRWQTACGVAPDGSPDPAPAFVFRIIPDCDVNSVDDESQSPAPTCTTNCRLGDMNGTGTVTVQDIFDLPGYYFANDLRADVNNTGTVTVQDIFDFLAIYFSCS